MAAHPRDLWLNRAPYPSNGSLLTWLENAVIPDIAINPNARMSPLSPSSTQAPCASTSSKVPSRATQPTLSHPSSANSSTSKMCLQENPPRASFTPLLLLNNGGPVFKPAELNTWRLPPPPEQMSIHSSIIYPAIPSPRQDLHTRLSTRTPPRSLAPRPGPAKTRPGPRLHDQRRRRR